MKTAKKIFYIIVFILIIVVFIIGIGVVDNANKTAQSNPFLNGIFIDSDNYILWFRYLGLKLKISYDFNGLLLNLNRLFKLFYLTVLIIANKILGFLGRIV